MTDNLQAPYSKPQLRLGKYKEKATFSIGSDSQIVISQSSNYQATGIRGVLGYFDGTHIAIKALSPDNLEVPMILSYMTKGLWILWGGVKDVDFW
ncbi:hypothetical protein J437_LFUL013326, partial [Ladona fulva]